MLKLNKWFGIASVFLALNVGAAEPAANTSGGYPAKPTAASVPATSSASTSKAEPEVPNKNIMQNFDTLKSPQPVDTGAKIEVLEFFWYGCPHCYSFEPELKEWLATLPKDVEFRRIPAIPFDRWTPLARTYYTVEALGETARLHNEVFDAIHKDKVNFEDQKAQLEWMAKKGIDRTKFTEAWNSFSVQSNVKRAAVITEAYKIEGVPMMAIDGKFTTLGGMNGTIFTLNALIEKARIARKPAPAAAAPAKIDAKKKDKPTKPAEKPLP